MQETILNFHAYSKSARFATQKIYRIIDINCLILAHAETKRIVLRQEVLLYRLQACRLHVTKHTSYNPKILRVCKVVTIKS